MIFFVIFWLRKNYSLNSNCPTNACKETGSVETQQHNQSVIDARTSCWHLPDR